MENLERTLVEGSNSGWWGMRELREERAKNWSPKYVWRGSFATSAHSDPHPSPQFANAQYELFKLGHFPGSVHCCSVHILSSCLHKQWIEGTRLWRISAYSTRFVASYRHPSTSYKTSRIACQSPEIAPNSNNPRHQLRLHARERVRQNLRPGGGEYPNDG